MQKTENTDLLIEQMFEAGAHYGYSKSRRHPSVSSFIYTTKNRTDIIDLEKTKTLLAEAKEYAKELGAKRKTIVFVGTKPEARESIQKFAESLNMPYVIERWIGGTFSNFVEIKKRIVELENYRKDSSLGNLEKYTKKERAVLSKKMERLSKYYSGLIDLTKIPEAIFVIDAKNEHIAVTEAIKSGVKVISVVNSDSNIKEIDYPIVANDTSVTSIKFFTEAIANAYKEGQNSTPEKEA
jgi:small subunit ribosomal protein S2